jgi:hypothetical protein
MYLQSCSYHSSVVYRILHYMCIHLRILHPTLHDPIIGLVPLIFETTGSWDTRASRTRDVDSRGYKSNIILGPFVGESNVFLPRVFGPFFCHSWAGRGLRVSEDFGMGFIRQVDHGEGGSVTQAQGLSCLLKAHAGLRPRLFPTTRPLSPWNQGKKKDAPHSSVRH